MNLLALNVHWVADLGVTMTAFAMGTAADGIPDAVADLLGPVAAKKILAAIKILGALGLGMTYFGRPRTVKPQP